MAEGFGYDTRVACVFCATADTARVGVDKRGHPYLTCGRCGARSFLPSRLCLDGYGLIAPLIVERARAEAGYASLVAQLEKPDDPAQAAGKN